MNCIQMEHFVSAFSDINFLYYLNTVCLYECQTKGGNDAIATMQDVFKHNS